MVSRAQVAAWLRPEPHHSRRSVVIVQRVVAGIVAVHAIYAMTHPLEMGQTVRGLQAHGLPLAPVLAWAAMSALLACSAALVVRRFVVEACLGMMAMLAVGIWLFYLPRWFVAGGNAVAGHPGVEFNVLLIGCLAGVLRAHWPRGVAGENDRAAIAGLALVRITVGLMLLPHSATPFVLWDVVGMRRFGEGMSEVGFPFGVPLVWMAVGMEALGSIGLLLRCAVVPACFAQMVVLGTGVVIEHYPDWFMVGPGEGGMEFPLLFLACHVSFLLAYWPSRQRSTAAAAASGALAAPELAT